MRFILFSTNNLRLHRDPLRVPADIASAHPICIKCKHYIPPSYIHDPKKGYCRLSGMMHVVDGTIDYEKVEDYRPYVCKGQYFEEAPPPVDLPVALKVMDSTDEVLYTD